MSKNKIPVIKATEDAKNSVAFIREHGSQLLSLLNVTAAPVNFPGLRPPIMAALLQPVSNGDTAKAIVLQKAAVRNSFKIDMYGYFQANNLFKFQVKGYTYSYLANGQIDFSTQSVLFTTASITAKTCTAEVLKAAIVATGKVADSDLTVTIGNLVVLPFLVQNEAMSYMLAGISPPDRPTSEVFSYAGCWYVSFTAGQLKGKAVSLQILQDNGQPILSSAIQALISVAVKLVPGGQIEEVMDVYQTSALGPLTGGTVVLCIDIPGIGYAIASAGPREFFVESQ